MSNNSQNQFGKFYKNSFILSENPPRKWNNVHYNTPGNEEVYTECSNLGDGPHTVRDYEGNTCNVVGYDSKYLYIRNEETGTVFTPWGDPVSTQTHAKQCVFHPAFTEISSECEGLRVTETVFVPKDEACEIWKVEVKNLTDQPRKVSLFAYSMFQLSGKNSRGGGVWTDNSSRIVPEIGGVFVENRDRSVPDWKFNGFLVTTSPSYAGASGYRDYFTRSSFSLGDPKILEGWNADNRPGLGPDCAGVVQVKLEIPPHSQGRADFILGRADSPTQVESLRKRLSPDAVEQALAEQIAIEEKRATTFTVNTGNPTSDALVNLFSKKQMVSYLINKSGFRDNLQNDMAVAMFDWSMAKANLQRAISSQTLNGAVPHSFRPWNHHQYADKPAWLLHAIPWCLKESGELSFLDELLPYSDSSIQESVWQHLLRALRYLVQDTGAHGLCDQHFADWNDGLEPSEKTGARESIMVTQQLCLGLLEISELARRRNEPEVVEECNTWHTHFSKLLNEIAWDGAWYVRTLCSGGYTLGSNANEEGKIFVNTQSWAVLSGTATGERARLCMESVDQLIENDYGFSISAPPFTKFDERVGKFSASRPLQAENGGCYNHAAGFKGMADCMLGRAEEAWRTFQKVTPGSPWNPITNSGAEPFSFTNCYSLVPEHPGRAMYPWRTGTCGWMTMLLVEGILGAKRHYDGLLIAPCLPAAISHAKLTRTFRGTCYEIEILRNSSPKQITMDGQVLNSNLLPPPDGGKHHVIVHI